MKIRSMTATFGKLEKVRLEPGPGLTLIHAPNEGGKSTWAAFWRAMLYGIDTRERNRKGHIADKDRYQPWSGLPMEGEVQLEVEGREITIRRGPRGNVPFGSFSAVYTGTQEPVPTLTGANCGELLAGAGQEVFTRSALLGAGDLALTTAPELERRIAALVSSGEEDVSFSQTMDRLKEWKNRRQVNKSVGEIPRLERELAQVRESAGQLEELTAQIAQLEGERAALEKERDGLVRQQEIHRLLAQKKLSDRYVQAEEELRAAQDRLSALERELSRSGAIPDREALKQAQGELQYIKVLEDELRQGEPALEEADRAAAQAREAAQDERFAGLSGDEAVEQVGAQLQDARQRRARAAGWKRWGWLSLVLSLGLVLFFQFYFRAHGGVQPAAGWFQYGLPLLGVALFLLGVCCLLRGRRLSKDSRDVLARYQAGSQEELAALVQGYQEKCQKSDRAAHEAEVIRNAVTERQTKRDSTRRELLDFVHQFAPEVTDMFGCSAALSRALNLGHELALARERTSACRRRLEDLEAQGAARTDLSQELPVPELDRAEAAQALARTNGRLEQVRTQLDQARGQLRAMGDPAALSARAEELESALARRREELEAIGLAMDALTQANARLQERFSPELDRLSGQYMARLTGGKYPAVSLTRELEGSVRTEDGVLPRSALVLSRGTADQLYLAVRLAVCRLCLPDRPPIFLDDALASFDDRRLAAALELLLDLSREQQVLLFTCQKREGAILSRIPGVALIEL